MSSKITKISDIAEVIPGYTPNKDERKSKGKYLLIGGRNLKEGRLVKTEKDTYINESDKNSFKRAIAKKGDIIISTLFNTRKIYLYKESDPIGVVNNSCAIIRTSKNNDYIVSYLKSMKGERHFLDQASRKTTGSIIPRISLKDISSIQVPILPIKELNRLSDTYIEEAKQDDLLSLKKLLERKENEISQWKNKHKELVRYYQDRLNAIEEGIETSSLLQNINHGETTNLEFKSTLRWNIKKKDIDKNIELAVLKTIVAFCNSGGGVLLIGVSDKKELLGLSMDKFRNNDSFLLHLRNLIASRIIPLSTIGQIEFKIVTIKGTGICKVICTESNEGVWLKPDKNSNEKFYIRSGPSSTELKPMDAAKYILNHSEQK